MTPEKIKTSYYKEVRFVAIIALILSIVFVFLQLSSLGAFTVFIAFIMIMLLWVMPDHLKYLQEDETCTIISYQDGITKVDLTSCCRYPIIHGNTNCQNCNAKIIKDEKKT